MTAYGLLHRTLRALGHAPGIVALRRRKYARAFARQEHVNLYHGVFSTFEAAERSAPPTKPLGYDNSAAAEMYPLATEPMLKDYPALDWIRDALDAGYRRVFDLGGHIGIKYYAFRERLRLPGDAVWTVCDVPAVVARGMELARTNEVLGQLRFTTDWRELSAADVLYASGSVQYLPMRLAAMLQGATSFPARVVINSAALHPSRSFYTLNSIGVAFCPYRVQSEQEFLTEMQALGYRCVDRWETPKEFRIPFETGYDMDRFVGMAFER
jgi:putative methyltransferase (TIGR04325 family)